MILFVGGACDTGKGKIVFDLYTEAREQGKSVETCLDPVEKSCQELFGKSFDHFVMRRVFLHQKQLLKDILHRSLDMVMNPFDHDYYLANETPLGVLALSSWFGITVSLSESDRDELLEKALAYSTQKDTYHIIVQPWQETVQRKWTNRFLKWYGKDLENVFILDRQENYNKTVEVAKIKARELLGW